MPKRSIGKVHLENLLFNMLKVVQGGRIRTMVIAHSLAQHSSEIHCLGRLNRSGEPSRLSRPKQWISPTLKPRLKWLAGAITIARMLCTGWDLFIHRNFQQGGGGVTGFPILYRKRKFIEILPEISGFYNFDEVFAYF